MKEVINPELKAYQEAKIVSFREQNSNLEKGGIVFAGDSLIEFFPLKKYLGRSVNLINRGIAGSHTELLLDYLKEQILDLQPAKVFILIGTNDLGLGKSRSDIFQNIIALVTTIKAELLTCQIYLLSLLPVNEDSDFQERVKIRKNTDIKRLNQDLANMPGIEFVDIYESFLDEEGQLKRQLTSDGLHLNATGYAHLSKSLKDYIS